MTNLHDSESTYPVNLKRRPLCPTPARICHYLIQGRCCHVEGDGRNCPNPQFSPVPATQVPTNPVRDSATSPALEQAR